MSFGKNRIQYKPFNWRYFHYPKYDIYFYSRGQNLAKYVATKIPDIINQTERFFGTPLQQKLIFVVYNKLSDFRQSNVGLKNGNADFNVGGKLQIVDNKVFVYFEGDHQKFEKQIKKVVAKIFLQQILYGHALTDILTSSTLLNVPKWFEDGLVSYVAQPFDIDVFNKTRDILKNQKHINFNHLTEQQSVIIGHSFWYFIADTYGADIIPNLLYFTKISKNIKNATYYVMGVSLKDLYKQWRNYYEQRFDLNDRLPAKKYEIKITHKHRVYQEFKISPDGTKIAYVENFQGRYKVFVYDLKTRKKRKLYREGQRLDQIVDYSYPVVEWNYTGKVLAFTTEKKSNVYLWTYFLDKKKLKNVVLPYISKVNQFAFSPKGTQLVFSAISDGYSDIFVYNLLSGTMQRITYDLADDLEPRFTLDGKKIIFSSNRSNDTLRRAYQYKQNYPLLNNYNLYLYNLKKDNGVLTKLSSTPLSNEHSPINIGKDKYIYLSDSTGTINRMMLKYDSTISFIDTTVHYRFFSKSYPLTNYTRNILDQDFKRNLLGEILYENKKYRMFEYKFPTHNIPTINADSFKLDYFAKEHDDLIVQRLKQQKINQEKLQKQKQEIDSLKPYFLKKINTPDSNFVNINNYIFDIEKDTLFAKFYKNYKNKQHNNDSSIFPQMWVYHKTFYIKDVMSQVDFSMLNQCYQPFTGSAFQFNQGMTYFTTVSLDELFNDYKLIGGFRFGLGGSMEYIFSIENLAKRLDKQIIYHRQVLKINYGGQLYPPPVAKTRTNELIFAFRYPFNQVSSVKFSFIEKYDRKTDLSTEYNTLIAPDTFKIFSGVKFAYIFDNTKELSLNLLDGMRMKFFAEFYQQVQGAYDYTSVLGADIRFYKNIFRNFIFASRIAGATSFGSAKVIFYLGGVDNWVNLSLKPQSNYYFDRKVNINYKQNYIFQAVATNMRGFPQNIRNGNSFLVANNELRMPIVQMFFPYPVNSDFWHNLQIVGFFDIGEAWAGLTPYDPKNMYNEIFTHRNPFTVIVHVDRPPFVYGYGWGVRTKILGYFVRLDWAWGVEANYHYPKKFYISLSKDF
jgi:Tol biopolymer transport system component